MSFRNYLRWIVLGTGCANLIWGLGTHTGIMSMSPGRYFAAAMVFLGISVITMFNKPLYVGFFNGALYPGILILIGYSIDAGGLLMAGVGCIAVFIVLSLIGRTREEPAKE